jgi:predicted nucleotidyltransferase
MDRAIHKNGLTKKEMLLLKPFVKEPWKDFTTSEIKVLAGKKSHHFVFEALKKLVSMGILAETRKGNINFYRINFSTAQHISYLVQAESIIKEERSDIPYNILSRIIEKIKSPFFTLIICGSYAEKKQKPKSDIDVAIIIPNSEPKKQYEIALRQGDLTVPEAHGFVFTQDELYQMLVNNEFNYGKELARKHIIVQGAEQYYKILFEAINHGFKG